MKLIITSFFFSLIVFSTSYAFTNKNELCNLDTNIISSPRNEVDSIKFLIQQYYGAPTSIEKLKYILNSDKLADIVNKYYAEDYSPEQILKDNITVNKTKIEKGEYIKIRVKISDFKKPTIVIKKCADNSFKIDWEATVGYNPQSLTAYVTSDNATPMQFRFELELSSLFYNDLVYNGNPISNTEFISIHILTSPQSAFAWVSKNTPDGKKLFDLLGDGKLHKAIVTINTGTFKDNTGNDTSYPKGKQIIITQLNSEDWIIK